MISASLRVVRNLFPGMGGRFEIAVEDAMNQIGQRIIDGSKPQTPVDTGELIGSSYVQVEGFSGYVGWRAEHAIYQNFGTSRGIVGKHFAEAGAKAGAEYIQSELSNLEGKLA